MSLPEVKQTPGCWCNHPSHTCISAHDIHVLRSEGMDHYFYKKEPVLLLLLGASDTYLVRMISLYHCGPKLLLSSRSLRSLPSRVASSSQHSFQSSDVMQLQHMGSMQSFTSSRPNTRCGLVVIEHQVKSVTSWKIHSWKKYLPQGIKLREYQLSVKYCAVIRIKISKGAGCVDEKAR